MLSAVVALVALNRSKNTLVDEQYGCHGNIVAYVMICKQHLTTFAPVVLVVKMKIQKNKRLCSNFLYKLYLFLT